MNAVTETVKVADNPALTTETIETSQPANDSPAMEPKKHLSASHEKLITDSVISSEVTAKRGYETIKQKSALKQLGFADYQSLVPALLCPVWGVNGEIVTYQIRPDKPRINKKTFKPLKYETPADS